LIFSWVISWNDIIFVIPVFKNQGFSHLIWDIVLVVEWWKFESILPSFATETTFIINWWWSLRSIFFCKLFFRSTHLSVISEISFLWLCKFVLSVISIIVFVFVWVVCVNQIVLIVSVFKDKWLSHLNRGMNMVILVVKWREFESILPSLASEASFVWRLFYLSIISVVIEIFIWIICINQIVIIISVLKN
jgi:hypothetical protein